MALRSLSLPVFERGAPVRVRSHGGTKPGVFLRALPGRHHEVRVYGRTICVRVEHVQPAGQARQGGTR